MMDISLLIRPYVLLVGGIVMPFDMTYWFSLKSIYDVPIPYKTNCRNINHKLDLVNAAPAIGRLSSDGKCQLIGDVEGKVAFIKLNSCSSSQLLAEANKHGAKGVITELKEQLSGTTVCELPLFYVWPYYFDQISEHLEITQTIQMNFKGKVGQLDMPEMMHVDKNSVQDFSSNTLSYPDVSAPSTMLFTTIPVRKGFYELANGPSLAAAYAAGTAALLVHTSDKKRVNIAILKARFHNTAAPVLNTARLEAESVVNQGAGLLDAFRIVTDKLVVIPSSISLGNDRFWVRNADGHLTRTIRIKNISHKRRKYIMGQTPVASVSRLHPNQKDEPKMFQRAFSNAKILFSETRFELGYKEIKEITVKIIAPEALRNHQTLIFSGYITVDIDISITPLLSYGAVRIPYFGIINPAQ